MFQYLRVDILLEVFETFRESHRLNLNDRVLNFNHLRVCEYRVETGWQAFDCLKIAMYLLTIHLCLVDLVGEIAAGFTSLLYTSRADSFYSFVFALSEVRFLCVLLLAIKGRFHNDVLCRWLDVSLGWKVKRTNTWTITCSNSMMIKERTISSTPITTLCNWS